MTFALWHLISIGLGTLIIGAGTGFTARKALLDKKTLDVEKKNKELLIKAKNEALEMKTEAQREIERQRKVLDGLERTLRQKDENLDQRAQTIDKFRAKTEDERAEAEKIRNHLADLEKQEQVKLEKIASLSQEEARKQLFASLEKDYAGDLVKKIKELKAIYKEESEKEARKIIATVIGRYAGEQTAENTTYSITLPSDEMKGRIIGKEGRNIQHFEKITGVDVIIDDSPDTVMISSFDPVRRFIGKLALEQLVADGRIQQARIEEVVAKVEENVNKQIKEAGEQAVYEVGVAGLHPDLIKILGRLKFRTSYGQNQLEHSKEVGVIAGMLASEVGADINVAKKAGLLHDIGKAIDYEVSGAHHHLSMEIAKKYGLSEVVINAIGAHHDDIEPKTVEAILVKAADAISGSRPGARRESVEQYIHRMKELEDVANTFEGVEKSFAIQAGREIRILVKPEEISDLEALKLAKDIARRIEAELQFPGEIKVNVIRETRAIEIAK